VLPPTSPTLTDSNQTPDEASGSQMIIDLSRDEERSFMGCVHLFLSSIHRNTTTNKQMQATTFICILYSKTEFTSFLMIP
jgi:hypothetical protein